MELVSKLSNINRSLILLENNIFGAELKHSERSEKFHSTLMFQLKFLNLNSQQFIFYPY
jgi:hypothetical protein